MGQVETNDVDASDDAALRAAGESRPARCLDRAHIAAIVQQSPAEAYTLVMWRLDPTSGALDLHRGVIGDVDGHEILSLIDRDRVFLHLHDIDDTLHHFDLDVRDAPIVAPPRHRLRHGLLLASPGLSVALAPSTGTGAMQILRGSATLHIGTSDGSVALRAGATLARRIGPGERLDIGDATLVALTYDIVPRRGIAALPAAMSAAAMALGRRLRRRLGRRSDGSGAVAFRLSRARP
jgi:hypothetical protein